MSYVIIKTDGTILTTVAEGTINTTSTPLGIPGRLYPGYGQVVDTNFVHMLENFADTTPPVNALKGQLWFNTTNNTLNICPSDGESNASAWLSVTTLSSLATYAGNIGAPGSATTFNGNLLTTGSNANLGVITGNWSLSAGSKINNIDVPAANIVGIVANANHAAYASNVVGNSQPNITSVGTLSSLNVSGNVNASVFVSNVTTGTAPFTVISNTVVANLNADLLDGYSTDVSASGNSIVVRDSDGNVTANYFIGDGSLLTGLSVGSTNQITNGTSNVRIGSTNGNVTISVGGTSNVALFRTTGVTVTGNVVASSFSGPLATAAQPNVTSLGTLTSLNSSGNVTAPNIVATTAFYGSGAGLTSIPGANVTGLVPNANYSTYAGAVVISAQPNITSTGTLTSLNSSGNITAPNIVATTGFYGSGAGLTNIPASNISGSIPSATTAQTVDVTLTSTNGAYYLLGVTGAGAGRTLYDQSGIYMNPFTGVLTAVSFVGSGASITNVPYSSLTGKPTALSAFTNDVGYLTTPFPSGTALVFAQSSAPTGWTKVTAYDNAALRVVSGSVGSGGTLDFTTAFSASRPVNGTVGNTALTTSQLPPHNHGTGLGDNTADAAFIYGTYGGAGYYAARSAATDANPSYYQASTSTEGSGQTHTHTFTGTAMNFDVKYVDVIIATKN